MNKDHSISFIVIILLFCVFLFSGCCAGTTSVSEGIQCTEDLSPSSDSVTHDYSQDTSYQSPEYTSVTNLYHELDDYSYIIKEGDKLVANGNSFIFEKTSSEVTRQSFMGSQNELIGKLGVPEGQTYVLTETYMDRYDSNNEVSFLLVASIRTWKQVLTTIQLLEGDDITYGYAYAKANSIAKELGWETDLVEDISEADIEAMLADDPERLSLVYPCFISPYSTDEQISFAKALAVQIYESLEGDVEVEKYMTAIASFANEHSIPYHETYLKFADGGKSVPLIIRTLFVEEWVTNDFKTDSYNITVTLPDNVNWQKSISEMIRLREVSDSNIEHARIVLKFEGTERKIAVYFQYELGDSYSGMFDHNTQRLLVSSPLVICHEYVHYIHWDLSLNFAASSAYRGESLACYFSVWSEYEAYKYLVAAGERENNIHSLHECIEDLKLYNAKRVASMEISPVEELKKNDGWYGKYYSFGLYLSEIYGEETFGQLMIFPEKAYELVGKTMDTLTSEWEEYVKSCIE